MRDAANVGEVSSLAPDFMGFIFYPKSPRHFGGMPVETVRLLPAGITPVLVTVNLAEQEILQLVERYGFKAVQLHGGESPELCRSLRRRGLTVLKSASLGDSASIAALGQYEGAVDYLLFDTPSAQHGGTGRKFDWSKLADYSLQIPFFLSGGIGPDDVAELLAIRHPMLSGVDVNSRFEISPARKNASLLSQFISQLRQL